MQKITATICFIFLCIIVFFSLNVQHSADLFLGFQGSAGRPVYQAELKGVVDNVGVGQVTAN